METFGWFLIGLGFGTPLMVLTVKFVVAITNDWEAWKLAARELFWPLFILFCLTVGMCGLSILEHFYGGR